VNTTNKIALLLLSSALTLGCQFTARSAEDYNKETSHLLASKKDQLKTCYDTALQSDKTAAGKVAVTFTVEPKTGAIQDAKINEPESTAPKPLQQCVLNALNGLALDPPDQREGVASFTYEFKANPPKQG